VLSDARFIFWTRTVWNDEQSMRAFMIAGTHRGSCNGATRLQSPIGCRSRSNHHHGRKSIGVSKRKAGVRNNPSDAQLRLEILPPKTTRELKFK
jgi:hypothetical protein